MPDFDEMIEEQEEDYQATALKWIYGIHHGTIFVLLSIMCFLSSIQILLDGNIGNIFYMGIFTLIVIA